MSDALAYLEDARKKAAGVPGLPGDVAPRKITKAGVVGAGTMGGGIAMCFANAGIPAVVVEAEGDALDRGLKIIDANYVRSVKRGRFTEEEKSARMALIAGSLDFAGLKDCDIVIEAVFEDMALKKKIFGLLSEICQLDAILATNTSTLDVNEIATAAKNPERVLGLHFFSPANVMPLLEVVHADKTSPEVLAAALTLAGTIKKIPVVSGVCFGFIGNRMLQGYGREAQRMLLEGAAPRDVDSVLEDFGFAMGVLAVYDLAGIDVGHKIRQSMANRPDDPAFFKAGEVMFEAGRYGQKTGRGFYRYEAGSRERFDDDEAVKLIRAAAGDLGIEQRKIPREEILERCLFPLINEGARILEEGIALRASDIDVVWTAGYGFPRERGGPMYYADGIGLDTVLAGINKYRERFGDLYWTPAARLEKLASGKKTFADWDRESA